MDIALRFIVYFTIWVILFSWYLSKKDTLAWIAICMFVGHLMAMASM